MSSRIAIKGNRRLEILGNAQIIHNQAAWFVAKHPVDPRYCLHERMALKWFVQIHGMQAGNIKPCQPHMADNGKR